jgi:hypothetical protein
LDFGTVWFLEQFDFGTVWFLEQCDFGTVWFLEQGDFGTVLFRNSLIFPFHFIAFIYFIWYWQTLSYVHKYKFIYFLFISGKHIAFLATQIQKKSIYFTKINKNKHPRKPWKPGYQHVRKVVHPVPCILHIWLLVINIQISMFNVMMYLSFHCIVCSSLIYGF